MWLNRHARPIPINAKLILIYKDNRELTCEWFPYKPEHYAADFKPVKGYLGNAKIVEGHFKGVGFNVWEQNDSEFHKYRVLEWHDDEDDEKVSINKLTQSNMKIARQILKDGREALDLMPGNNRAAAIVDLEVLKRLIALLSTTSLTNLKADFIKNVEYNANDINSFVNILEEELAFQKTVNLINTIQLD